MSTSRPQPSKLRRAFGSNAVFLLMAIICGLYMDWPALLDVSLPIEEGFFRWGEVREPILEKFHLLGFLDDAIRDATVGFFPSVYAVDPLSWWQALGFLSDVSTVYMIWLMESSRPFNRGSVVQFPSIIATIAQFGTGGICFPLQYFLHMIYRPPSTAKSLDDLRIDLADAMLWLPLSLVLYTAPALSMYLAPDFATRNYYVWFWQLYPVRIGMAYYAVMGLVKLTRFSASGLGLNYQATLRSLFTPCIALQASIWVYTVFNAPCPLRTIFLPGEIEPEFSGTFVGLLRRLLQLDHCSVMASSFLWLFYLMWDLSSVGLVSRQQLYCYPLLLVLLPLFGPGAAFTVMWLWKEQFVVPAVAEKKGM